MRAMLFILALCSATPALAHDARRPPADPARLAAGLANPDVQDALATSITRLTDILLGTKVGALAALTDPADGVRPGDSLGDVKRREDPDFDRRLAHDTRHAVAVAGATAGGMIGEAAEIQRTADRLRAALAPLLSQ